MSQTPTTGPATPGGSAPVDPPRKKRPAWLIPLVAAVVVLLLLLLLLSQCGGGNDTDTEDTTGAGAGAAATATTAAPTTGDTATSTSTATTSEPRPSPSTPAASSSAPTASPSTGADGASDEDATLVTGDGTSVLALAADTDAADATGAGLASVEGQDATATGVAVESVPADEGFWVGTGEARVWAQLDGPGESDFTVEPGQQLDFTAQVVPNDDAFLQMVGLSADEGADQLQAQGQHLLVDRTTLTLAG